MNQPTNPPKKTNWLLIGGVGGGLVLVCSLFGCLCLGGLLLASQSSPSLVEQLLVSASPSLTKQTANETLTSQIVIDQLIKAGFDLQEINYPERELDTPLPQSFDEHVEFVLPEIYPKGGQFFICSTKKNCDALYAYFDALKAIGGPYYYQSRGGKVVIQMNSGLSPDSASGIEAVVIGLP